MKQIRFAHLCAEQPEASGTSLAKQAGYTEASAKDMATANLRNPEILKAVDDRRAQLAAAAGVTIGLVLREWLQVATADATEIQKLKVRRCDSCWPIDDRSLPINPKCTACEGAGVRIMLHADTDSLSPAARRLIAGYRQTRDGIEVKLRDQDLAWRNLADYLGMLNKSKGEVTGPGGGPMQVLHADIKDLTDEQLMAIAAAGSASLGVSEGVLLEGEPLSLPAETT